MPDDVPLMGPPCREPERDGARADDGCAREGVVVYANPGRLQWRIRVVGDGVLVDGDASFAEGESASEPRIPFWKTSTSIRWLSVPPGDDPETGIPAKTERGPSALLTVWAA